METGKTISAYCFIFSDQNEFVAITNALLKQQGKDYDMFDLALDGASTLGIARLAMNILKKNAPELSEQQRAEFVTVMMSNNADEIRSVEYNTFVLKFFAIKYEIVIDKTNKTIFENLTSSFLFFIQSNFGPNAIINKNGIKNGTNN